MPLLTNQTARKPFAPKAADGWQEYYKAGVTSNVTLASGRVSALSDLLGSGGVFDHATASKQPIIQTVDGIDALYFDSTNRHLTSNNTAEELLNGATGATIALLVKTADNASEEAIMAYATNTAGQIRFHAAHTASKMKSSTRITDGDTNTNFQEQEEVVVDDDAFHIEIYTIDPANATGKIYRDGVLVDTKTSFGTAAATFSATDSQSATLGSVFGSFYFEGWLGYVGVRNKYTPPSEIPRLTRYIEKLFRTKSVCNRYIIVAGDSIAANTYLSHGQEMHHELRKQLGNKPSDYVTNVAVDGRTIDGVNTNRSDITSKVIPPGAQAIVYLHVGTNDIHSQSQTPAQAKADLDTLVANLRTDMPGVKIVYSKCIPRLNESTTTDLFALNDLVVADTDLVDAIADTTADTEFDSHLDVTNSTYYDDYDSDKAHPTYAGLQLMTARGATAINAL